MKCNRKKYELKLFDRENSLTLACADITHSKEWLFHIIPFSLLRHTDNVDFHSIPYLDQINSMDRVIHSPWAVSPWKVWEVAEWWYMHPSQEDNLITTSWTRIVELYHPKFSDWKIEKFELWDKYIKHNWKIICDWPGILGWPTWVYHRNNSPEGSASLNLWIRFKGFNVDTEFNIYDIDLKTNKVSVIRKGSLDQPSAL
jgi:hypothetical protein